MRAFSVMKTVFWISLTLVFFASNSVLCRLALATHSIDASTFTVIRLFSGAVVLNLLNYVLSGKKTAFTGKGVSGIFLLLYALLFSLAYVRLTAATGALILFGCVQITMIGWTIAKGSGPTKNEWLGILLAVAGLVYLLAPGLKRPDPLGALLMAVSGVGWGAYSILGKGSKNPVSNTAGNFFLSALFSLPLLGFIYLGHHFSPAGFAFAALSGAVSSGIGYSIWYTILPTIKSTQAAIVQLLVPAIAALLGALLLHEAIPARLILAGGVIASGVLVAVFKPMKSVRHAG